MSNNEELEHVHGFSVPAKGIKVAFTNLGKECTATGDGVHSCYELSGHHNCTCCEKKAAKPKAKKESAPKKTKSKAKKKG